MKQRKGPNEAQMILMLFGVNYSQLLLYGGKRETHTKSGPGRTYRRGSGKKWV